jgi:hypothetical protein
MSAGLFGWAEIRRLFFVEKRSKRAIHKLTAIHRDTIAKAIEPGRPRSAVHARETSLSHEL